MGHLMKAYRRNSQLGHIEHFTYDSEQFPEGFYDSPSKVPPLAGPAPLAHLLAAKAHDDKAPLMASPVIADERSASPKRGPGRPLGWRKQR